CKPTYGRVSTRGVVPLAPSMDHPGPMARCVWDVAVLLQAIAGPDPADPTTLGLPGPCHDLLPLTDAAAPVLGRVGGLFHERAEPVTRAFMAGVEDRLRRHGAAVEPAALPPEFNDVLACHRVVMAVEAAAFHGERLERHPEDYGPSV